MRSELPVTTGRPAADFRLLDTEGREQRLADYRGAWLLLVFHRHLR
ncbi:MAG: redoxin domain-containing protein [Acidobacteria bacterium]|nr:redoxin domain-containing protein [Acidobacteriota bacterium]